MKRIVILLLALALAMPAFAQVGRYKSIKIIYPGYSLKLDSATGELSAVHFDKETEVMVEEVISKKQSHNPRQIDRYEFRRTNRPGLYQIFDSSSGKYTTVKWAPKGMDGEEIKVGIDSAVNKAAEGIKRLLKELEESLDKAQDSLAVNHEKSLSLQQS